MSSFKSYIRRKSQSFPKSLKKYTTSELGVELSTFVPCEWRWSWYRMTHWMCHAVPQPVYFTWQCLIRYHNQCLSPDNMLCGTKTSAFHLVMCHTVPQPVQHDNAPHNHITHCQVKYTGRGTVCHIARVHWSWYRMTHCQLKYTGCDTVWHIARLHWHDQCNLVICHTVPQPVYFTWQCVMRYHDQCTLAIRD
jgi:hypothetical protein